MSSRKGPPGGRDTILVDAGELRRFSTAVLMADGMTPSDASLTADAMVWADLRGRYAHGAGSKLPQCVTRIREGGTSPTGDLAVIRETDATFVIDGRNSWGQVAASKAVMYAVDKARKVGTSVGVVRNCNSAAALGYYPLLAVAERMIGITFTNGPPLIAPTGGTTRLLGNQAHAIACPTGRHFPIVYDAATTSMSTSEMDLYHDRGERLPSGVLFTADGRPTTDPSRWVEGILAPAGGYRGYGLSLMLEILTGILAGGVDYAPHVGHPFVSDEPQGVSLFVVVIDPDHSIGYTGLTRRVDSLIDRLHASDTAPGVDRIYVPGERGFMMAARREEAGIPMPSERVKRLRRIGAELDLVLPQRNPAAGPDFLFLLSG